MPSTARFLQASSGHITAAPPTDSLDSDVVVILAALLCALICVVGLALVARCACLRRAAADPPPPNKGLKKRALRSLPTATFDAAAAAGESIAECAICLAEFADGDQIRVLPPCGHGFHAGCVDTWLGAHSSCPSCRRVLVVVDDRRCRSCGSDAKPREDGSGGASRFLP